MNSGFDSFKDLYNNGTADAIVWDINQLRAEQQVLQPIHEKYLSEREWFTWASSLLTNTSVPIFGAGGILTDEKQGQPGGVDILDYRSRVQYGCKLLGYSADLGCKP
jgi:filamentous hemagglutinin